VLPERNGPDLEDVPEAVREQMTFHLAASVQDVLSAALSGGEHAGQVTGAEPQAAAVEAA
jgi:ATP-dependent Lon protease